MFYFYGRGIELGEVYGGRMRPRIEGDVIRYKVKRKRKRNKGALSVADVEEADKKMKEKKK